MSMSSLLEYILTQEDAFRKNRLPSLYSDFRLQKRTNPDGYDVNVRAWEQALVRAGRQGYLSRTRTATVGSSGANRYSKDRSASRDYLLLTTDTSLLRDLEIPELGMPVALGAVFEEAVQRRTMIPLQLYKTDAISLRSNQRSLADLGFLSPWRILGWSLKRLTGLVVGHDSSDMAPKLQTQELVLVENLKEAADRVVKRALSTGPSKMDLVYSKDEFMRIFATALNEDSELSAADFDVLLLYISRDCGAIAYDGMTIKFRPAGGAPPEITQQDTTIASIKSLISTVSMQIETLEGKINSLTSAAKVALGNKNRISAISAIRSKKLVEHSLKQRLDTMAQLEEVYSKIERATDQIEYVKVMEASAAVLRGLNAQIGGIEKVEDVASSLHEEMSKVDEVGQLIAEASLAIDDGEIEGELEDLEAKDREAREEKEAEEIHRRLAALDSFKRPIKDAQATESEQSIEAALAESVGRLSRMSIKGESDPISTAHSAGVEDPLSAK